MVKVIVESIPTLADRTFLVESEVHTSQVLPFLHILMRWGGKLAISMEEGDNRSVSTVQGGNSPVTTTYRKNYPSPITQGGSSPIPMKPPPSSMVGSFDWSRLARHHLPPYVAF